MFYRGGRNRGVNLPSPYFLSQLLFLPPPYFLFPHPGPSSSILPTPNFSFSPSSLLSPPISPYSQLFLGHFSLLPILFLPPPSVCACFWCYNLQQLVQFWKFAATVSNLQQLYSICSNFILFAATLFYLQQHFNLQHVPCGPPYLLHQSRLKKCLHFDKCAHGSDVWNTFSSYIYVKSEKTSIRSSND